MPHVWPKVGTEEFITLGELPPVDVKNELVTRSNVNGVAIRKQAVRGDPLRLIGVKDVYAADAAGMKVIVDALVALQTTTVTIRTNAGIERENIYIQKVKIPLGSNEQPNPRKPPLIVGGIQEDAPSNPSNWVITVEFTVIDTNTAVPT